MAPFAGFKDEAFAFYSALAENNEKAWFEANKSTFQTHVRDSLQSLMDAAVETFGGTVKLSRPHRDVRFSKDKSPYKQNLFGVVHSREGTDAALYASISIDGVHVGTGYHEMTPDQLARFRAALDEPANATALREAMDKTGKRVAVRGRALTGTPRGFAKDHPAIDLIRMKEVISSAMFPPGDCRTKALQKKVFDAWRAAQPVNDWLDRHVGASEMDEAQRMARRPKPKKTAKAGN